jgi:membrane protease YdiL (CAAX protease family)
MQIVRSWLVAARVTEFVVLFFVLPTVFSIGRHRLPAIPGLWVLTAYCLFVLLHDPGFGREHLWSAGTLRQSAATILLVFAVATVIGTVLVLRFAPGLFLSFPRTNPRLWGLIMLLYPVLSVYPQGIVYRAFVFERYRDVFSPGWAIVLASTIAFAYAHIVFRNPLAVGLTFLGGLLFGFRYLETGSLFASSFEHALYGCAIFTMGLGRWFSGAMPAGWSSD